MVAATKGSAAVYRLQAARRALRKRRRISAKVTVRVADAAGNATILRRVIRFKR